MKMKKLMLLLAFPLSLQAAVIYVDDNNLSTQTGTSQYPYSSIQIAIVNAVYNDTIKVAVGSYININNNGKALFLLGGYTGATSTDYSNGIGGNFTTRSADPALTIIGGNIDSIGVNLTRFDFTPFHFLFDNFTVSNSQKGINFDVLVSWPRTDSVIISNNIVENNGQAGITTAGGGIIVMGSHHQILNNIIRNNQGGRGAGIAGNFSADTLLIIGNLIENNFGYDDHCGGVYLGGYVEMNNNIISGNRLENTYGWGGGVLILGTAHMSYNIIKDNHCPTYGGAVFIDDGAIVYMDHELIYHNSSDLYGGGIAVDYIVGVPGSSELYMTNCTVVNNYSPDPNPGNGVFLDVASNATITNCIFSNTDDFLVFSGSTLTATYTLSDEGIAGTGNFTDDPVFADTLNEDFHLKSTAGRYDPISSSWVIDAVHSPAIDAGDATSSFVNEPTPNGNRINLGCYGNTAYASKSTPIGIETLLTENKDKISVYPNPTNGNFQLIVNNSQFTEGELVIYNMFGEKIYQSIIFSLKSEINLNLANGVYFYQVRNQQKLIGNGKLIVQ